MRARVEARAQRLCEYCWAPQGICAYTFHIDHIQPRSKSGADTLANCALACFLRNSGKGAHVAGLDPQTGREEPLFHPRQQTWAEHFEWIDDFTRIQGATPIGRATVVRLKMNEPRRVEARALWRKTGRWP